MDKNSLLNTSTGDYFSSVTLERYRLQKAIVDSANLFIITTSPEGIITTYNKVAEKFLGYAEDEIIGVASFTLFLDHEEITARANVLSNELGIQIAPGFETFIAKPKYKKVADEREWTFIGKDRTPFPVLVFVTALFDDQDVHLGYLSVASPTTELKEIRKRIEESDAQLQSLISSLDDIVFELDEQGRFKNIWVKNDDYLFLPREKIYGRTLSELFGEEFANPFEVGFRHVLETGETFNYEYKSLHPEDNRWFSAKCSLIYEKGKRTNRVSLCIRDITERKRVELSLLESQQKFKLLAENMPAVVYLCRNDEHYSVIYVNDKIKDITGYTVEDFFNGAINFAALIHEEDKDYVVTTVGKALEEKVSYTLEYRIRNRSGEVIWIEEKGVGVYSQDQVLIEGYISDISKRKKAEEELRRIADENKRMFNNTISLNSIAGFDGYFKQLNPAWEKILGWTIEELKSKGFKEFVHPDDVKKTMKALEAICKGNDLATFENRYRCRDGSYRWLLWSSAPDLARKLIYATAVDITDRKKSEEQLLLSKKNLEVAALELQDQNQRLDEFAHIISHNLRSPVGNIKALISFIDEKSTMEDYRMIFEKINNVANNLSETMNELMETLKVKKGTEIERVEIRFKDVLDKTLQSLEGELIKSGASVTFDFNDAPKIYYSKTYLESIFQNLISNAIKYRSPKRTLKIYLHSYLGKNGIELRVSDNGLGIDLARFGNKLFGLHKTFHGNKEARGVGLFLTKMQIEALGGTIAVESEVNEGTTFTIQF